MWCRQCQQEVPEIGTSSPEGRRCARCSARHAPPAAAERQPAPGDRPDLDATDTRRVVDRVLRTARATVAAGPASTTLRFDLAQTGLAPNELDAAAAPRPQRRLAAPAAPPRRPTALSAWTSWGIAALGAVVLGMGLGLIGWSTLGGRHGLWTPGLAATLAGQGLLIVGLLQVLANMWSAGRHAAWRLGQMHDELRRLRRASEESAGRHTATAAHFYAGLASDAGPHVLVGNLQGQVDRLAARLRAE